MVLHAFTGPFMWKLRDRYSASCGLHGKRADFLCFLFVYGTSRSGKTTLEYWRAIYEQHRETAFREEGNLLYIYLDAFTARSDRRTAVHLLSYDCAPKVSANVVPVKKDAFLRFIGSAGGARHGASVAQEGVGIPRPGNWPLTVSGEAVPPPGWLVSGRPRARLPFRELVLQEGGLRVARAGRS